MLSRPPVAITLPATSQLATVITHDDLRATVPRTCAFPFTSTLQIRTLPSCAAQGMSLSVVRAGGCSSGRGIAHEKESAAPGRRMPRAHRHAQVRKRCRYATLGQGGNRSHHTEPDQVSDRQDKHPAT